MMQLQSTYQTEQIEGEEIRGITNTRGGGTNRRGREDIESQTITNDDDGVIQGVVLMIHLQIMQFQLPSTTGYRRYRRSLLG